MMCRCCLTLLWIAVIQVMHASSLPAQSLKQILDPAQVSQGDSLLWTALVAKSWQDLGTAIGVPALDLRLPDGRTPSPVGEALHGTAALLDKTLPPSTKVWAGEATPEFLQRINNELSPLFPGQTQQLSTRLPLLPGSYVAVSALNHRLEFVKPFYRAQGQTMRFVNSAGKVNPVRFFGTQGAANESFFANALQIYDYKSAAEFLIEIKAKSGEESLWILRTPEAVSVQKHLEVVKKALSAAPPADNSLTKLDVVKIPYLDFTHVADHTLSFAGKFKNAAGIPYRISHSQQWIDFKMDEGGAQIRAKAEISAEPFGSPPSPPKRLPRHFICDGPFTVLLWRKEAALPYAVFHLDGGNWQ